MLMDTVVVAVLGGLFLPIERMQGLNEGVFWQAHESIVMALCFSPKNDSLASGGFDSMIHVWDVSPKKRNKPGVTPKVSLKGHKGQIFSISYRRDGRILASAGVDHSVIVWDVEKAKEVCRFDCESAVYYVRFSPNGELLAAVTEKGRILVWHGDSFESIVSFNTDEKWLNVIEFSADSKRMVSGGGYGLTVWESGTNKKLWRQETDPGAVRYASFLRKDLALIVLKEPRPEISILDSKTGDSEGGSDTLVRQPTGTGSSRAQLSPSGTILAVALSHSGIDIYDVPMRKSIIRRRQWGITSHSIAFSPDGMTLAEGREKGAIVLWRVADLVK